MNRPQPAPGSTSHAPFLRRTSALVCLLLAACGPGAEGEAAVDGSADSTSTAILPFSYAGPVLDLPPDPGEDGRVAAHETERDWAVAAATVSWAREQGLAALPTGEVMAILGTTFVGAPYEPGTLELPGAERLVVNLQTFDCVTLVEQVLVLAHLTRDLTVEPGPTPGGGQAFRDRYRALLTEIRYRDATLAGYTSRLHYFTEWMDQGIARGLLAEVTDALGGTPDPRPIHFMSSNPEAYAALREAPGLLTEIRAMEARLSQRTRLQLPETAIAGVEGGIQNGDIIAAVSRLDGLDIAHTGLAIRHQGRIHLLHAPLVGDSVEISARPLAERIQGIGSQTGIRVVRPLDR
jgi:hypothetical protein